MKQTIRHIIKRACFLSLFGLTVSLLCLSASGSAKVHSGRWGKNAKWSYDTKTKTVTIACQGRMQDEGGDQGPFRDWSKWHRKAKRVVFKKGITYIGSEAFNDFRKVKEVILPEGLESIGNYAFYGTMNLKQIRFPSTLKKIGWEAFGGSHDGLESVFLRNVKTIGSEAFSGINLKSLTIPSGCTDIKSYAFSSCFQLKQVRIENGIQVISSGMFSRTGLKSVTIPASVTKIGKHAFYAFSPEESKLKSVTINSTKIKEWGKEIFGNARKDLVIKVPKNKKKEYTKALREGGLPKYVKIVGK